MRHEGWCAGHCGRRTAGHDDRASRQKLGVKPVVFSTEKNAPAAQHAEVTYGDDDLP